MSDSANHLSPGEVAALLDSTSASVRAEMGALSDALAGWHPAPGEWCAKEVLGHLIETERRGFAGRIRTILASQEPHLPGWDPEAVARDRGDCRRAAADVLGEFVALRNASVELVRDLTAAELARGGLHEQVGYLRVDDLLHEWVHHDCNHVRQLLANIQEAVWPHLGNAQRFAGE